MPEPSKRESSFRVGGPGGEAIAERARARVSDRLARGILTPQEIERVSGARLLRFDSASRISEAFRRCCVAWEVDRPALLSSHRPVIGVAIVAFKRLVARLLRFQNDAFLIRQTEFNRNLLLLLRELLERTESRR